jgi:hypothetical protein
LVDQERHPKRDGTLDFERSTCVFGNHVKLKMERRIEEPIGEEKRKTDSKARFQ